jgi:hypothetical protein
LDYPNLLQFPKMNNGKLSYILSHVFKVRENCLSRKCRFELEDPSSQSLIMPIQIFPVIDYSAPWESLKDFSHREGTNPFKTNQHTRRWNRISSHNQHQKQKIFKTTHVRKRYIIEKRLNCRMKYSKYSFLCSDKLWESLYVFKERVRQSSYL